MADNAGRKKSRTTSSPAHNSIACESCRSKKRRCDRVLPVCGQCARHPSQCQFPEQNKRGLPSGYVNKLEARLAETEAALCHILDQSHGRNTQDQPYGLIAAPDPLDFGGPSRGERVKEWGNFPLQSMNAIQAWYHEKRTQQGAVADTSPTSGMSSITPENNSNSYNADIMVDDAPVGMDVVTEHQIMAQEEQGPVVPVPVIEQGATTLGRGPDMGTNRARELSQSHYNLYF